MSNTEMQDTVSTPPHAPSAPPSEISGEVDFFAPGQRVQVMVAGATYVEIDAEMSEASRRKFLNAQTRMITIGRSGDQTIPTAPGDIRHALLTYSIVGWNVQKDGRDFTFSDKHLKEFLDSPGFSTSMAKKIEDKIMELNPGLGGDATREDLEATIKECEEQLERLDEAEGKDSI